MDNERLEIKVPNKMLSLAATEDAENIEIYRKYLDQVLKDKSDQYNVIAVTGGYASGKSSIINTYLKNKKNKTIKIILGIKNNNEDYLEKNIIEQILYSKSPLFNPLSKINRMDYTKSDYIFKNSTLLLIILIFVTIFYNIFSLNIDYYSFYKDLFATKQGFSLFFESLILSLIYIFIFEFVYNVLMLMVRTGLYSFKIKDIEVTNEELVDDKNSLLDKYKSEIIHFFKFHKCLKYVVIEDIDRFQNKQAKQILIELKEINKLVNIGRKKKIKFIIEIKDDFFSESEERSKFYDLILPVVPYTSSVSNRDLIYKCFNDLCGVESEVRFENDSDSSIIINTIPTTRSINLVCEVTSNPREIKDIINEYNILLRNYSTHYSITKDSFENIFDEIFLLAGLKVVYPKRYQKLLVGKSNLFKLIYGIECNDEKLNDYEDKIFKTGLIGLEYIRIICSTYQSVLSYDDQLLVDIMKSNSKHKINYHRKIDDKKTVLAELNISDFSSDSICNIYLFQYIYNMNQQYYLDYFISNLSNIKIEFLVEITKYNPNVFSILIDKAESINMLLEYIKNNYIDDEEHIIGDYQFEYIISAIMMTIEYKELDDNKFFNSLINLFNKDNKIVNFLNNQKLASNKYLKTYDLNIEKIGININHSNLLGYMIDNSMYKDTAIPNINYIRQLFNLYNFKYDENKLLTNLLTVKELNIDMYQYYIDNIYLMDINGTYRDGKDTILKVIGDIKENISSNQKKIVYIEKCNFDLLSNFKEEVYEKIINSNLLNGNFKNIKILLKCSLENKNSLIANYINNRVLVIFDGLGLSNKKEELQELISNDDIDLHSYRIICKRMKLYGIKVKYIINKISINKIEILIKYGLLTPTGNSDLYVDILDDINLEQELKQQFILNNYIDFVKTMDNKLILDKYLDYLVQEDMKDKELVFLSNINLGSVAKADELAKILNSRDYIPGILEDFLITVIVNCNKVDALKLAIKYESDIDDMRRIISIIDEKLYDSIFNKRVKSIDYSYDYLNLMSIFKKKNFIKNESHTEKRPKKIYIYY